MEVYCGYFRDNKTLMESSSGGAATVLAEMIIDNGGIVYGVKYSDDFKGAEYARICEKNELNALKGSKYIYPQKKVKIAGETRNLYDAVEKDLLNGKTVLFFGMSCEVGYLKNYCKKMDIYADNLILVDLICQGPVYEKVAERYISELEHRYKDKVVSMNVRHKKYEWAFPCMQIQFESGKVYERFFYNTEYGIAFSLFSIPRCYNCSFKGEKKLSDITLGDFWGADRHSDFYNRNGMSVLFANTDKGKSLIKEVNGDAFFLKRISNEEAENKNPFIYCSRNVSGNNKIFWKNLYEKNLFYAIMSSVSLGNKIKILVKLVIPDSFFYLLKNRK